MTTPTLTASLVTVASTLFDMCNNNKEDLGIAVVYYGDQDRIESTPALCVEPVRKDNRLEAAAASRLLYPDFEVSLIIYHSAFQSPQSNRKEADQFAESIETFINQDKNLGDQVIHGYVSVLESGYITRANTVMRAARLTYTAKSRSFLPS